MGKLLHMGLALLSGAVLLEQGDVAMAGKILPSDVVRFLERREGCDHWAGEEPYDRARRREIEAAVRTLRCDRIERDADMLRRRYARRPDVVMALRE